MGKPKVEKRVGDNQMPSPFPGMDPFIEMDQWQEFHVNMIVEIQRQLVPLLVPKYIPRVERRVYTEHMFDEVEIFQPDVEIVKSAPARKTSDRPQASAAVAEIEPREYAIPLPHERGEPLIRIVDRGTGQLVTLIEFLSPSTKARGSDGFKAYFEKREEVLLGGLNLVEIDLLRRGSRLPTVTPLEPTTDYCVFVHRAARRGHAKVYEWPLAHPLPAIRVPLAGRDEDVVLDLQRTFTRVFDEAGYEAFVRYDVPLRPPLRTEDVAWVQAIVESHR
jgi:hypothetical protein